MDIVNEILEKEQKKAEKYKPIIVEKHLDVEFDIGTLLASDTNDLDNKLLKYVYLWKVTNYVFSCNKNSLQ